MAPGNELLWERWEEIDSVFEAALDHPPEERETFLALACAGDRELLKTVRLLLAHHSMPGDPRAALDRITRSIFAEARRHQGLP